ncbi:MAG: polyprenol monophosphomannose synthase [Chloroflexi bacterium]|nr:MAG: polyprenol monophosphomannose synthase [Chloroflexota bacterium]
MEIMSSPAVGQARSRISVAHRPSPAIDAGQTIVCLPTYNEAPNIEGLIAAILRSLPNATVLVVDDGSPDHTGEIVQEVGRRNRRVELLARPSKLGLGTAYLAAMTYALERDFEAVITMDADFSHPPDRLPALLAAVEAGADLAIGSRSVEGGAIRGWSLRTALRLRTHDGTGGFRCYRRHVVQFLVRSRIRAAGYSALIESLALCERAGLQVAEVPITFVERVQGRSKISRREIAGAIRTVVRLAVRKNQPGGQVP